MKILNGNKAAMIGLLALIISGCQPSSDPPPDLIKTQREVLNKAKALDGQMQKNAQDHMKAVEDAQK
jgi:hypothetical protein